VTIVAVLCNVVLFLFTCFVLLTEGPSKGGGYIVLTALLLLIPILSAAVILRTGPGPRAKAVVAIGNIALLGLVIWAIASAYPYHPEEAGVLPFAVMCVLIPILNLLVILRRGARLKSAIGA
jgi:hypothetical protein